MKKVFLAIGLTLPVVTMAAGSGGGTRPTATTNESASDVKLIVKKDSNLHTLRVDERLVCES
ncbi:hypothetical protein EXT46_07520 [Pseudoalteromonas sp. CO325X]|uniref:hypothetical protein n=1 Tax=Pseudoalteromonas sp. CO325X TaxID=1777262 RepID=UPI001023E803|nr:hypothetical protein [Pseudoalteromonas sp. CO325X]RZF83281.1 hypothetical protein EXT46_07520 [Pseudoalteromonas sp. CO325X]